MINWHPHKLWLSLLALALIVGMGSDPFLTFLLHKAEAQYRTLQIEKKETTEALQQLQDDIAAAKKMSKEIDEAAAKKYLAHVNRLKAARIIEQRAAEALLSNVSYTLSPERPAAVDVLNKKHHRLVLSDWEITADAPTDLDIYGFLDTLDATLPGRILITRLAIRRLDDDTPLSEANLHIEAKGTWLSNGAPSTLMKGNE